MMMEKARVEGIGVVMSGARKRKIQINFPDKTASFMPSCSPFLSWRITFQDLQVFCLFLVTLHHLPGVVRGDLFDTFKTMNMNTPLDSLSLSCLRANSSFTPASMVIKPLGREVIPCLLQSFLFLLSVVRCCWRVYDYCGFFPLSFSLLICRAWDRITFSFVFLL